MPPDAGAWVPIVAAIVTTLLTVGGGWFAARRLRKLGLGPDQLQVNATLRELADVEREKVRIRDEEIAAMRVKHAAEVADLQDSLEATRRSLDDCARQRDNAWSELRNRRRPAR